MQSLVSVLLLVGAVCSDNWEHLKHQEFLKSRFPAWTPVSIPGSASLWTVTAQCGEGQMLVVARLDLFGTGCLLQAADLTLGPAGCPFTELDPWTNTVTFHCGLSDCGTAVMVTADHLLYTTHLYYTPRPSGSVIVRTTSAVVLIECRYPRKNDVNSQAVWPTWAPLISTQNGGGFVLYSLHQMNDDWDAERASNVYYLGESIHIEASAVTMHRGPVRLYVDLCVATPTPDQDSTPRYQLIDFNGCLMDSRASDSGSSFVTPRTHQNKLQIKLGAFRFLDAGSAIFITCHLKVAAIDGRPDPVNKACFFQKPANEWAPVEGPGGICLCCGRGNCRGGRRGRSVDFRRRAAVSQFEDDQLRKEGEIQMGPLVILAAEPGDQAPTVRIESQNATNRPEAPEHTHVQMKTVLILVGLVGAVALMLSGLMVGGVVICGALTIFNLYNKLT
ncbi:zona pellucida sperm-binding protein 3-like [Heptranchias perlo]|uniref:zona pellucida sperm-binding protein 3-like n=1 Tax=Heptranchias perlo TaxID=212740 RepID=UPI00355A528C